MVPARWTVNDFHRFNFVQPLIFLIMSKGYQNSLLRFFRPTPYSKLFSYFFFINPRVIHVVNRTFKKRNKLSGSLDTREEVTVVFFDCRKINLLYLSSSSRDTRGGISFYVSAVQFFLHNTYSPFVDSQPRLILHPQKIRAD